MEYIPDEILISCKEWIDVHFAQRTIKVPQLQTHFGLLCNKLTLRAILNGYSAINRQTYQITHNFDTIEVINFLRNSQDWQNYISKWKNEKSNFDTRLKHFISELQKQINNKTPSSILNNEQEITISTRNREKVQRNPYRNHYKLLF